MIRPIPVSTPFFLSCLLSLLLPAVDHGMFIVIGNPNILVFRDRKSLSASLSSHLSFTNEMRLSLLTPVIYSSHSYLSYVSLITVTTSTSPPSTPPYLHMFTPDYSFNITSLLVSRSVPIHNLSPPRSYKV